MSIDNLLNREYSRSRYNCLHFSTEAWLYLTGDERLARFKESDFGGRGTLAAFRDFKRVDGPTVVPSVVLMENIEGAFHMGICLDRWLLHIDSLRPEFFPIANYEQRFKKLRYFQ